jgi:adenylate kinase family enzyme
MVIGLDDVTGELLVQRDDDKPESVRTRLAAYDKVSFADSCSLDRSLSTRLSHHVAINCRNHQATAPLVDYYTKKGVLNTFHGTMSDVIYPQVKNWLENKTS